MAPNAKDKWVRRFLITETSRHKKGFTVYKVTSVIYPKSAPEAVSRVSIWKRYNEFRKLHLELSSRQDISRLKESFPEFPKPKFFGRFESEVIEERRQCAIKLLEFIARHTALFTSNVFVKFFESGHSVESINQDRCSSSVSLSSDTSDDDYRINYPNPKATNYNPTTFQDQETNDGGCNNGTDNRSRDHDPINSDKNNFTTIPDPNSINVSSKVDNFDNNPSQNNNYADQIQDKESNDNEKEELGTRNENSVPQTDGFGTLNDGSDLPSVTEEFSGYIINAASHMSAGFRHEALGEFGEAFTQYKLGISILLDGVQGDPDPERRGVIKEKISQYLERAEKLYNRHLNCNVSVLSKSRDELKHYKVLRIIGNVMLVRDTQRDCNRVIKTVQKPSGSAESLSDYILRGKIPFMVRLYGCIETDSTIFLILQYASGGKLWEYMKSYHKGRNKVSNWNTERVFHTRSSSCEAIIQKSDIIPKNVESVKLEEMQEKVVEDFGDCDIPKRENISTDSEESLKKLEEEFGGNSLPIKSFPVTDLLAKSQELLRSVDATLRKSNSIASRLNESENLMFCSKKQKDLNYRDDDNDKGETTIREIGLSEQVESPIVKEKGKVLSKSDKNLTISDTRKDSLGYSNSLESQESRSNSESINCEIMKPVDTKLRNINPNEFQYQSQMGEDSGIEMDDELWKLPEGTIRFWAAEILVTLESLHRQDVIIADLKPDNILLGNGGHVAISYIVPARELRFLKLKKPYSAPELCMFLATVDPTTAADVWSYGILLYELFTGIKFQSKHPGPFHSHSILNIPEELSSNVKSLISNILRYKPEERLTIPEIREHPFFSSIDWTSLVNSCFT